MYKENEPRMMKNTRFCISKILWHSNHSTLKYLPRIYYKTNSLNMHAHIYICFYWDTQYERSLGPVNLFYKFTLLIVSKGKRGKGLKTLSQITMLSFTWHEDAKGQAKPARRRKCLMKILFFSRTYCIEYYTLWNIIRSHNTYDIILDRQVYP